MFINSLFKSIENVDRIKEKYSDNINIWVIEKEITNETKNIISNIDNIDKHARIKYNYEELNRILKNEE